MAFSCEVDDSINFFILHEFENALEITDIHLHKLVVGLVLNILEVRQVARIGELIQIDNLVLWILVHKQANNVRSYETGSSGDDYGFHIIVYISSFICLRLFPSVSPWSFLCRERTY